MATRAHSRWMDCSMFSQVVLALRSICLALLTHLHDSKMLNALWSLIYEICVSNMYHEGRVSRRHLSAFFDLRDPPQKLIFDLCQATTTTDRAARCTDSTRPLRRLRMSTSSRRRNSRSSPRLSRLHFFIFYSYSSSFFCQKMIESSTESSDW